MGTTDFPSICFCEKKKQEIEQKITSSLTVSSQEDFFSELYYPDEIVMENEVFSFVSFA